MTQLTGHAIVRVEREQTTEEQVAFVVEPDVEAAGSTVRGAEIGLAVPAPGPEGLEAWSSALERDVESILTGRPGSRSREGMALRLVSLGVDLDADAITQIEWHISFQPPLSELFPDGAPADRKSTETSFRQVKRST